MKIPEPPTLLTGRDTEHYSLAGRYCQHRVKLPTLCKNFKVKLDTCRGGKQVEWGEGQSNIHFVFVWCQNMVQILFVEDGEKIKRPS